MNPSSSGDLTRQDVAADLKASLGAQHELGPEMQDHVIEAFLARIEQRIDARVEQRLAERGARPVMPSAGSGGRSAHPERVIAPSLALAIPLVAIAGGLAGGFGILAVILGVIALNAMYLFHDRG